MADVEACPECRAGKHQNCNGDTYDLERDEIVECPCYNGDPVAHRWTS